MLELVDTQAAFTLKARPVMRKEAHPIAKRPPTVRSLRWRVASEASDLGEKNCVAFIGIVGWILLPKAVTKEGV